MNSESEPAIRFPADIHSCCAQAVKAEASDIHLFPGRPPVFRVHGDLKEWAGPPLADNSIPELIAAVSIENLLSKLHDQKNIDFSFETKIDESTKRFRANAFFADEKIALCLRLVPGSIPDFEWSGFPRGLAVQLANLRDGLVILTGITGSGKTTTLAMIVNLINKQGGQRIITVEEPVEYRFPRSANSMVTQREVGIDVLSFQEGLRSGLRQDPDIILIGEIRDRETAQMALSAAETGHLVFTTLHTRDSKGAISRYSDLFPQDVQTDIRMQLALSLRAVISQRLLPDVTPGNKRHLALEILWNTPPISTAIRQAKLDSIDNYLLTRRDEGMLGFDESVRQLFEQGLISREVTERNLRDPSRLSW